MDFAPYQASPPEHSRPFSPPAASALGHADGATSSPRGSFDAWRRGSAQASPPPLHHPQPQRAWSSDGIRSPFSAAQHHAAAEAEGRGGGAGGDGGARGAAGGGGGGFGGGGGTGDYFNALGAREGMVSEFDTSLGLRLDYEACLAYLLLPPLGAILLLILERKSDYVRFHAWQSSLVFTAVFIVHLLVSASRFLSWFLFLADMVLIGWLVLNAYRDADTLDRYEVPVFGQIASRFLDDE